MNMGLFKQILLQAKALVGAGWQALLRVSSGEAALRISQDRQQ